ncbi:carbohydrate sulfotransferase 11-like [Acanthaster planci]|uniref:Carbohydrate sulfotransferase n=1 Tax=Acanthaster planci TaxID=133434 RepID=A0A8B7XKK2_ACAPL|nr:carbohydrate sulfotransferase 11-like [Acanthaster planci]
MLHSLKSVVLLLTLITISVVVSLYQALFTLNLFRDHSETFTSRQIAGALPKISGKGTHSTERRRGENGELEATTNYRDASWIDNKAEKSKSWLEDRTALELDSYRYLHHPETVNRTYDVWQTQQLRRKVLRETCDSLRDKHRLRKAEVPPSHLLVDDRHRFVFCEVRKVSSIAWRRVLDALASAYPAGHSVGGMGLRRLGTYSAHQRERRLSEYTKFLFVRDPMLRLVSGWRDKFLVGPQRHNYQSSWGAKIRGYSKHRARNNSSSDSVHGAQQLVLSSSAVEDQPVSFTEFVKYLTAGPPRSPLVRDMHWETYNSRCRPCLVRYDFVGHYETLGPDAAAILNALDGRRQGNGNLRFPAGRSDSLSVARQEFPKLASEDVVALAKLYDVDYELFGYSMSRFRNWLQNASTTK